MENERWYKSEYETVIVVLFAVIAQIVPWNITIVRGGVLGDQTLYFVRWWFGILRAPGGVEGFSGFAPAHHAILLQQGTSVFPAYVLWGIAAILTVITLLFAAVTVVNEPAVVKAMDVTAISSGLFAGLAALYFIAWGWLMTHGIPGIDLPTGGIIYAVASMIISTNNTDPDKLLESSTPD